MDFAYALQSINGDLKVERKGWNGKGMFLFLVRDWKMVEAEGAPTDTGLKAALDFPTAPFIAMKTADNKVVPWLASQTDILADDWFQVK